MCIWMGSARGSALLTAITINPTPRVTITKGQTVSFTARGTYSDGSVQDPLPGVTWTSENLSVASVNPSGLALGARRHRKDPIGSSEDGIQAFVSHQAHPFLSSVRRFAR